MRSNLELSRGRRLPVNIVKVQLTKNGQYTITVPRTLARAMGLQKGSIVQYELLKQGGIKIIDWRGGE